MKKGPLILDKEYCLPGGLARFDRITRIEDLSRQQNLEETVEEQKRIILEQQRQLSKEKQIRNEILAVVKLSAKRQELWWQASEKNEDAPIETKVSNQADNPILATVRKLLEFGDLESDWDSYGAPPIALKAVQKAEKLFSQIADQFYATKGELIRPFDVAPRSDGGVQFEWRSVKGALEVEIHADKGYGYLLILGEGESRTSEESDNVTTSDILALFSRIIG